MQVEDITPRLSAVLGILICNRCKQRGVDAKLTEDEQKVLSVLTYIFMNSGPFSYQVRISRLKQERKPEEAASLEITAAEERQQYEINKGLCQQWIDQGIILPQWLALDQAGQEAVIQNNRKEIEAEFSKPRPVELKVHNRLSMVGLTRWGWRRY